MLFALCAVLGLAWLMLRLLRNRSRLGELPGGAQVNALRFVRALPLGPKERVVIIEHNNRRWMLGVTAGGISKIDCWPAEGSKAALESPAAAAADSPAEDQPILGQARINPS